MRWERWRTRAGAAAIVLALGGIFVATVVSPSFAWRSDALSDLGVAWSAAESRATVLAFDGGLIAGGVAGLAFARSLAAAAPTRAERAVVALFGLTVVLMGLVAVFPRGNPLHLPVSVGFYALTSLTLWADGLVERGAGQRSAGFRGWFSARPICWRGPPGRRPDHPSGGASPFRRRSGRSRSQGGS